MVFDRETGKVVKTSNDVFGTKFANFDKTLVAGLNSDRPNLDTKARYLYVYQIVNDSGLQAGVKDITIRLLVPVHRITSWGHFVDTTKNAKTGLVDRQGLGFTTHAAVKGDGKEAAAVKNAVRPVSTDFQGVNSPDEPYTLPGTPHPPPETYGITAIRILAKNAVAPAAAAIGPGEDPGKEPEAVLLLPNADFSKARGLTDSKTPPLGLRLTDRLNGLDGNFDVDGRGRGAGPPALADLLARPAGDLDRQPHRPEAALGDLRLHQRRRADHPGGRPHPPAGDQPPRRRRARRGGRQGGGRRRRARDRRRRGRPARRLHGRPRRPRGRGHLGPRPRPAGGRRTTGGAAVAPGGGGLGGVGGGLGGLGGGFGGIGGGIGGVSPGGPGDSPRPASRRRRRPLGRRDDRHGHHGTTGRARDHNVKTGTTPHHGQRERRTRARARARPGPGPGPGVKVNDRDRDRGGHGHHHHGNIVPAPPAWLLGILGMPVFMFVARRRKAAGAAGDVAAENPVS